jgi:hypothetical protein
VADPTQTRLPPEVRAVLGRFVGDWDVVVTIDGRPSGGQASARWTMEGSYVEFRSHTIPPGDSDLQVMTYSDGVYLQWLFDSSGYRHEATGSWDQATSTLTWRGPDLLIEDRWVSPDRLEWTLHRADREIGGVVTRRPRTQARQTAHPGSPSPPAPAPAAPGRVRSLAPEATADGENRPSRTALKAMAKAVKDLVAEIASGVVAEACLHPGPAKACQDEVRVDGAGQAIGAIRDHLALAKPYSGVVGLRERQPVARPALDSEGSRRSRFAKRENQAGRRRPEDLFEDAG